MMADRKIKVNVRTKQSKAKKTLNNHLTSQLTGLGE